MKEAFRKYFPEKFFDKPKQGFNVPVGDWLRNSLKKELISYVDDALLLKQNIFNHDFIKRLVYEHLSGKKDNTYKIWTFYCFQKWYKNYAIHG